MIRLYAIVPFLGSSLALPFLRKPSDFAARWKALNFLFFPGDLLRLRPRRTVIMYTARKKNEYTWQPGFMTYH